MYLLRCFAYSIIVFINYFLFELISVYLIKWFPHKTKASYLIKNFKNKVYRLSILILQNSDCTNANTYQFQLPRTIRVYLIQETSILNPNLLVLRHQPSRIPEQIDRHINRPTELIHVLLSAQIKPMLQILLKNNRALQQCQGCPRIITLIIHRNVLNQVLHNKRLLSLEILLRLQRKIAKHIKDVNEPPQVLTASQILDNPFDLSMILSFQSIHKLVLQRDQIIVTLSPTFIH